MRYGLEAWNRPDLGQPLEWERVEALGGRAAKLRAYHSPDLADRYLALWPDCLFLLRRAADGWPTLAQVEEIRPLVERIRERGAHAIYLVDSEPNLGSAALTDAYRRALGEVVLALDTAYPELPLCSPPMAVQQRDLEWLAALESDFYLWGLEYRAAHLYWQWGEWASPDWGRRIEQYTALCPGAKWIIDEVGDSTPAGDKSEAERADAVGDVLAYLRRRGDVEAATVFITGTCDPQWDRFVLPPAELGRIRERLEEEEKPPMPDGSIDKEQILASLDTLWGITQELETQADQLKDGARRIRDYVVAIKQAAGLDTPNSLVLPDSEGVDIGPLLVEAADRFSLPLVSLVALGQAESNWRRDASRRAEWPDWSDGYGQITIRLAAVYGIGDGKPASADVVHEAMLDRPTAIRVMADHFELCLKRATSAFPDLVGDDRLLQAMICYNSGSPQPEGNWYWEKYAANVTRYRESLAWAHRTISN